MNAPPRTTFTPGETVTHQHPIRGFFWGLLMGLGLAVVAVITKVVALSLVTMIALVVVGVLFGVLWGIFAPAKKPKGPAPAPRTAVSAETTRFDDFDPASTSGPDDYHQPTGTSADAADAADGADGAGNGGDDD